MLVSTELSSNTISTAHNQDRLVVGKCQPRAVLDEGELRVVETLARTALVIIGLGLLVCWKVHSCLQTNICTLCITFEL